MTKIHDNVERNSREYFLPFFEAVQDPDDWRKPIKARVHGSKLNDTVDAIAFFTGAEVNSAKFDPATSTYEVTCVGYRNGPCGP